MPNLETNEKIVMQGITFDDVLLLPSYAEILPSETNLESKLACGLKINAPIISSAMDTVTESATAIVMAQYGGIGIIHKNMSLESQKNEIKKVKEHGNWLIKNPVTISSQTLLKKALYLMTKNNISSLPVVDYNKLVGIITKRDIKCVTSFEQTVNNFMTKKDNLVTASSDISLTAAKKKLHQHRLEKLLCVDDEFNFKGIITIKDIEKTLKFPMAAKDSKGRLLVGAALGASEDAAEIALDLMVSEVDVLVVDSAHGHSKNIINCVQKIKQKLPKIPIIAGNVATEEAALDLIKVGSDAIKVGMGPGSICTTRIVAGIGVPQISAIFNCSKACKKNGIPLIADGGIKYSGDIVKAISAGADTVMLGSLLAGAEEAPGEKIFYQGRSYKQYRGMGSIGAMNKGSADRYSQAHIPSGKYVSEGIEGITPYKGYLGKILEQLIGGLRAGMGYSGVKNIEELQNKTKFVKISSASLKENYTHSVLESNKSSDY